MSDWVAEAARLPIAFAQVREDPRIDLAVIDSLGMDRSDVVGIMIASGGCTAAALVASGRLASLHLVDANASQFSLTRFKLHLLRTATPAERQHWLGHAAQSVDEHELKSQLMAAGSSPDTLGPPARIALLGLDHAGRYEMLFQQLRDAMNIDWPELLSGPAAASAVAPHTAAGRSMDAAFDRVMAIDHLIALFGLAATQNSVEPFSRHFAARTRHALTTLPTADNPFLWQLLVGRFPPGVSYDWLTRPPPARWPELAWSHAPMHDVLDATRETFDFIHLSNILDWLTPAEATRLLASAYDRLRPGGRVIVRQLNSTLDLPALAPLIDWLIDEADALHAVDRSFFYRRLHLGRRP